MAACTGGTSDPPGEPSVTDHRTIETARFVARENRFVVRARRSSGAVVRAYLPNTARLADLLVADAPLVLVPADDPRRRTEWTATRVWDGTWVALDAGRAADLVAAHLRAGRALAGWPPPLGVRREVTRGARRFDLSVRLEGGGSGIVEVKSLTRARGGDASLSRTPSARGVAHLRALGELAEAGERAAVVFVVQRGDVARLDLTAPADPGWVRAVRGAWRRGVEIVARRCEVDRTDVSLGPALRVHDGHDAGG